MAVVDSLNERASFIRHSLRISLTNTESMVSVLGSFDHRLSALDAAMRPIQVGTHAVRLAHENIDKALKSAELIIGYYDLIQEADSIIQRGPHRDLDRYLGAIKHLKGILRIFNSNKSLRSNEGMVSQVNNLIVKGIVKLEDEFKRVLLEQSKPVELDQLFNGLPATLRPSPEPSGQHDESSETLPHRHDSRDQVEGTETTGYTPPTLIDPSIFPLLQKLAQQLVKAGRQQQCLAIYREVRSSALEKSLSILRVEKLSKEEVQKLQWESLEGKIGNWVHFMRIVVKLLFVAERQLSDKFFNGISSLKDQCFAEITSNSFSVLLIFGEAITSSKISPEKLFGVLDMYEVMYEIMPKIELLFEGKACSAVRESALILKKNLAQTAINTFRDFEDLVGKDVSKTLPPDGAVHPLTSYVINYLKYLLDYQSILKHLFVEFGPVDEANSKLASVTMQIMLALQNNLDSKSKQYKVPSLACIFLMNNIHYIVKSVQRSEAKDLLGDDWIQRHRRNVQQIAIQYRRIAWAKILQSLSGQGLTSSGGSSIPGGDSGSSGVSRTAIKERFRIFNMQFEELHQRHSEWTVPDQELCESLRLAVAEVLLPAYSSFIKRFGQYIENNGKGAAKYVRYTREDLEARLGELFGGRSAPEQRR